MSDDLWSYSLTVYANAEVERLCLLLQEDCDADVNCVLACCWAGAVAGRTLSRAEIHDMIALSRRWGDEIINPLRSLRRNLKTLDLPLLPTDYRERVKSLELEAEHCLQKELYMLLGRGCDRDGADTDRTNGRANGRAAALENLAAYGTEMSFPSLPRYRDLAARLVDAVFTRSR